MVTHTPESAAARATPLRKMTSDRREPLWKTALMVVAVMVVIYVFIRKGFSGGEATVEAHEAPVTKNLVTAEDLARGLAAPAEAKPGMAHVQETPRDEERPPAMPPAMMVAPPAPPAPAPPIDRAAMRSRVGGSAIVAVARLAPLALAGDVLSGRRTRHIPRGTLMSGFLESKILSDNLDSRVRVRLVEDYQLGSDVILPAGGFFIGDARAVDSRYQKRLAVRVSNYIYPDREREIPFSGLLLNPDESAHLVADDVQHHTAKLIAGTTALSILSAASGFWGAARGSDFAALAGAETAGSLGDVAKRNIQDITQIVPTLVVEAGKPCWIFVEASFDVPDYATLPADFAPPAPATAQGGVQDPRLDMLKTQMGQVDQLLHQLPPPPTPPTMAQGTLQ